MHLWCCLRRQLTRVFDDLLLYSSKRPITIYSDITMYYYKLSTTLISYTTPNFTHKSLIPLTVRRRIFPVRPMYITSALKDNCPCQNSQPFVCISSRDILKAGWFAFALAVKGLRIGRERVNTTYDAFPAQVVEQTVVLLRGQKQRAHISHPPLGRVAAHVEGWGGWTRAFVSY